MIVFVFIYFCCAAALFYSYVLYPLILQWVGSSRSFSHAVYRRTDNLPEVIIFFSVFNGEKVLEEKIESMLASDYPADKIRIVVGSDESSDNTDAIVQKIAARDARVELHRFSRRGKANVINGIRKMLIERGIGNDTVFVLTDAYAIFEKQTLFEMVKHFRASNIGIVGANYINTNLQEGGISHQEKAYIQRENLMKYWESTAFGSMMGVYGACYAIRGIDFPEFPSNILMEDFYVTMLMLKNGKQSILTLDAKFYENIPNSIDIEYRRKRRIAAGNFQNLGYFKSLLSPAYGAAAFTFFSHKVLRWLGPFFIFLSFVTCFMMAVAGVHLFMLLACFHLLLLAIPLVDSILRAIGINVSLFRFVTYFLGMNLAVLSGLWWYIKGIESNVWQPTARS
jgi:cellulose synthase/poly-beta-1,6-N-acetylglucosamine synthase-like glycosyltransferase